MSKKIFAFSLVGIAVAFLFAEAGFSAPYQDGTLVTSPKHPSVYEIQNGKRRGFFNATVYYTWYSDFKAVKTLTVEEIEEIELGNPMPIKQNTKLLKFPLNPKVYAVTENETIQHIPDEATAIALFGADWAKKIIELPEIYYLFYTKGPALQKSGSPNGEVSELTINIDPTCHPTLKEFKNANDGYRFCYPKAGVVTLEGTEFAFADKTDGELLGSIKIVKGYDSLEDYLAAKDGATSDGYGYNKLGVLFTIYDQAAGGWSGTGVIFQNQKTKEIVDVVYAFANDAQKDFIQAVGEYFKFTEASANTVPPYIKHVGVGECLIKSGLARFARDVEFGESFVSALPERYEFCYTHAWDMEIQDTSNFLHFIIPSKNGKTMAGSFSMDYMAKEMGETPDKRLEELKASQSALNLQSAKTYVGDTIISYNEKSAAYDTYNIEILRYVHWLGKEGNLVRVSFSFTGDYASYSNELNALKENLIDTFKFIE